MKRWIWVLLAGLAAQPALAEGDTLFKYQGKAYKAKDLGPAEQQQLFDVRFEAYAKTVAFIDQAMLGLYLDEAAKKANKTRDAYEAELFQALEPTEKDINDWYEQNKAMIPAGYKLEQIKDQIKNVIKETAKKTKRDDLIAKIRKDSGTEITLAEPVAPVVSIDSSGYPVKGKPQAKVTVVEFADYQCPHCKSAVEVLDKVLGKYDGKAKLVFLDYPIKGDISQKLAEGSYCAEQQGKYWEFHDLAYKNQTALHSDKDPALSVAKELKLDEAKFSACVAGPDAKKRVERAHTEGDRIGITGTPSIFINGKRIRGYDEPELVKEIDKAIKGGQS